MTQKRRRHSATFKFKVALAAAKETSTLNEVASEFNVHPNLVRDWKQALLEEGPQVFTTSTARQQREQEARQAQLYEQIGRLQMELEWLKKKVTG
ncbi:MAG: helix-turn-helix domain-containing protein [Chloroflexi bacterium]|nr:helix-turn-helix domain-containing protein [Chloroflexota bacterium]